MAWGKRTYCEDISPTYNQIKKEKQNNTQLIKNNISYTRIGDDMLVNQKTNQIEYYNKVFR